jgi:hypothetical protein
MRRHSNIGVWVVLRYLVTLHCVVIAAQIAYLRVSANK